MKKSNVFSLLTLLTFAFFHTTAHAADITRDDALAALWTDWKMSLQHSPLQELAVDINDEPGAEYVIAWPEGVNPDAGPEINITVTFMDNGQTRYKMITLPVGDDGQYSFCGEDITLAAEPMTPEFAADMGLVNKPPFALAMDDGMCGRIYMVLENIDGEWEIVLYRN